MLTRTICFFLLTVSSAHAELSELVQRIDQIVVPSHLCGPETFEELKSPAHAMFEGFPFDLARHRCLFDRDFVVTGASVSTGGGSSPMNVLAEASKSKYKGQLIAQPGRSSDEHIDRILALDPDYRTALVGTPDRRFLWILSRTPQLDEAIYQRLVEHAKTLGFPVSDLIRARRL